MRDLSTHSSTAGASGMSVGAAGASFSLACASDTGERRCLPACVNVGKEQLTCAQERDCAAIETMSAGRVRARSAAPVQMTAPDAPLAEEDLNATERRATEPCREPPLLCSRRGH